jgi:ribonuclease J
MEEIRQIVKRDLSKCEEKKTTDWTTIKNTLKDGLKDFLYEKTKRNPMIIPIITEV